MIGGPDLRAGRLRTRADLREVIVEGAARRIRPKLMTVMTTMIGLVPILWSTGAGADVMKRIAAPMVGGMVSATVLSLLVVPVIYSLWREWQLRHVWDTEGGPSQEGAAPEPELVGAAESL